jgi:polar amino acid transport system substrate-binding protein
MKRVHTGAAIFIVTVSALFFVAVWLTSGDHSLERYRAAGVIRVGYAVEAPYAFLKTGGEVTGESPEVAKRIIMRLGIRDIEWRQAEFGALISELEGGRMDVIAAGMFITPQRAERISFSEPTFHVREGMLVSKGNPRGLHSYGKALTEADIRIAVLSGAVEEALLRRMGLPESQLVLVPDALTGRVAVESGMADGLALSSPTIQWMALRDQLGKAEPAQPFEQSESTLAGLSGYGAFAFRMGEAQLLSAWNEVLEDFVGSSEHQELIAPFGFTARELPGTKTTKEILSR